MAVETLLGLRLEVDKLRLAPLIPKDWESYKIHYRYRETFYHITVARPGGAAGAPEGEVAPRSRPEQCDDRVQRSMAPTSTRPDPFRAPSHSWTTGATTTSRWNWARSLASS